MAKKLTSKKAKTILSDKEVKGHPLTDKQKKFFGAIAGGAKSYKRKTITLPKKELVEEHKELVKTLKTGSKSKQKAEAKEQAKELKQYKSMRKKRIIGVPTPSQLGKGFSAAGKQVMSNIQAGQKSPQSTRADYTINPLKGAGAAFKSALTSKRSVKKLQRGMKGYRK